MDGISRFSENLGFGNRTVAYATRNKRPLWVNRQEV